LSEKFCKKGKDMAVITTEFKRFTASNGVVVAASTDIEGDGLAYIIGDGLYLSAAHISYQFYSVTAEDGTIASGARHTNIRIDGARATIKNDLRGYYDAATLAGTTSGGDPEIRPKIVNKDIILLNGAGSVDAKSAGLVSFLDTKDMLKFTELGVLEVKRQIFNKPGNITGIDTNQFGEGTFLFSKGANPGESGDAYTFKFDSKKFIFGVQSSSGKGSGVPTAIGNYITNTEFTSINDLMERSQASGNITKSEPTNLIFGSKAADTATGTYRPDIMLGRGGDDMLDDGDGARKKVYANDRLFGGAGDDVLKAYQGNDLLHGGDHRDYGVTPRVTLEDDGIDTASYADFRTAHKTNPAGIAIMHQSVKRRKRPGDIPAFFVGFSRYLTAPPPRMIIKQRRA
jgi:hypothetical protein